MQTKFYDSTAHGPLLKSQMAVYAVASLATAAILGIYGWGWWQHHRAPSAASTSAPVYVIQPAQGQPRTATPAQVAQVQQPAEVTQVQQQYQPTDQQMSEWRHVPPGQEDNYAAYQQRLAAQAQPAPYATPAPTPDPIVVRLHARWQRDADEYTAQIRARLASATTDAERGKIQADIRAWKRDNPEPMRPEESLKPPKLTPGGYEEIPFK